MRTTLAFSALLLAIPIVHADVTTITQIQYVTVSGTTSGLATTSLSASPTYRTCTVDAVYGGIFQNPNYSFDVNTWCLSGLGYPIYTTCLGTETTRVTTGSSAAPTTVSITVLVGVPDHNVTTTVTATVFDTTETAKSSSAVRNKRFANALNMYPKRQAATTTTSSYAGYDFNAAFSNACLCTQLTPVTSQIICTSTTTVFQPNFLATTATFTNYVPTPGTGTVTNTVTTTITVPIGGNGTSTTGSMSSSSSTGSMSSTASSSSTGNSNNTIVDPTTDGSDWGNVYNTSTTSSVSPTSSTSSTSSTTSPTTATTSTTTTSSTTSMTPSPTATCPYTNGTIFGDTQDPCLQYQAICGRSFAEDDFSDIKFKTDDPTFCFGACNNANAAVKGSCQGFVWTNSTTTTYNCRLLLSTDQPIDSPSSVALLLESSGLCNTTTTTTSMSSTSMTGSYTTTPIYSNTTTTSYTITNSTGTTSSYTTSNYTTTTSTMTTTPTTYSNSTTTMTSSNTSNNTCIPVTVTLPNLNATCDPVTLTVPAVTMNMTETFTFTFTTTSTITAAKKHRYGYRQ